MNLNRAMFGSDEYPRKHLAIMTFLVKGRTPTASHSAGTNDPARAIAKLDQMTEIDLPEVTCVDHRGKPYSREQLKKLIDSEPTSDDQQLGG